MAFEQRQWKRNGDKRHKVKMGWNCYSERAQRKYNSKNSDMASFSIGETTGFKIQTRDVRNPPEALRGPLEGSVSRLCARASIICSFLKRQLKCHIDATRFPSGPDRTADRDLLVAFSSNILDFRRSPSPCLKFGSRHEDLSRFCR